jgi:hypothetical protein
MRAETPWSEMSTHQRLAYSTRNAPEESNALEESNVVPIQRNPSARRKRPREQMLMARALNNGAAGDLHHQERRLVAFLIERRDYSWSTGGDHNMSQRQLAEHLRMPEKALRTRIDRLLELDVLWRDPPKDTARNKRGSTVITMGLTDRMVEYLWHWQQVWEPPKPRSNLGVQEPHGSTLLKRGHDLDEEMRERYPEHWMDLADRRSM